MRPNYRLQAGEVSPETARKIIIVIASLGGGGSERVVVDLCEYLVSQGLNVTVLTLNGDDPDAYALAASVARERMEIRSDAHSPFQSIRFEWDRLTRMRDRIVSLSPDRVLSFIDLTNVRVLASLTGTGIPIIVSERIHPAHHSIGRKWNWLRRVIYRKANSTVVQTDDIANWFKSHVPTKRLVVIPNAVRKWGRLSDQEPDRIVLAIGRLHPQKGFDLLIQAFARSDLGASGWRLVILGEGESRASLERLAVDLGIARLVRMPGHVRDVADWISSASIFALSSRYEGFPNVLLEAMQMGRACIAFDGPTGTAELIQHDVNGLVVPKGDVTALHNALINLASDLNLRTRLGREAAKVSRTHDPEYVYSLWLNTLAVALRSTPSKPETVTR